MQNPPFENFLATVLVPAEHVRQGQALVESLSLSGVIRHINRLLCEAAQ